MRDLTGHSFGRLRVESFVRSSRAGRVYSYVWLCRCVCGVTLEAEVSNLKTGNTRSCGCLKAETAVARASHGHARKGGASPTYRSWSHMKTRCLDARSDQYPYYGGRGITLCKRWHNFDNFLADMGERPEGTELDRIDNEKNYTPDNCRWAGRVMQAQNRRNTAWVMLDNARLCFAEAAAALGVSDKTMQSWRRSNNVSHQEAIDHYASRR